MAIIDSLNEIIAKNGGEVSGRGGSIETKLKALSELSMGGGKVYVVTDGDTEGSMQFVCEDPSSLKPGDILVHERTLSGGVMEEHWLICTVHKQHTNPDGAVNMYVCRALDFDNTRLVFYYYPGDTQENTFIYDKV